MANLQIEGLDQMIANLQRADLFSEDTQREMLDAAGEIMKDCICREIAKSNFQITQLQRNVSVSSKIKRNKNGDPYISVSVKGKNKEGERYATILFVLNYGRAKKYGQITGGYFWTKGVVAAQAQVQKKLEEIVKQKLNEGGLL